MSQRHRHEYATALCRLRLNRDPLWSVGICPFRVVSARVQLADSHDRATLLVSCCQSGGEGVGRTSPSQVLPGPVVEPFLDCAYFVGGADGQGGALGEVSPQRAVDVLVHAALPGASWAGEEDTILEERRQFVAAGRVDALVLRQRHPRGVGRAAVAAVMASRTFAESCPSGSGMSRSRAGAAVDAWRPIRQVALSWCRVQRWAWARVNARRGGRDDPGLRWTCGRRDHCAGPQERAAGAGRAVRGTAALPHRPGHRAAHRHAGGRRGRKLRTLAENEMITERSEGGHRVVTRVTRVGVAFASETERHAAGRQGRRGGRDLRAHPAQGADFGSPSTWLEPLRALPGCCGTA